MNLQKENGISWTDFTANPVRGKCLHNCPNCYAEAIRQRFKMSEAVSYTALWFNLAQSEKFYRENNRYPKIFIGSMHDVLGRWIPKEQIEDIIFTITGNPDNVFQFLTQNPSRYAEFEWPDNCWLGTTVRTQEEADERIPLLSQAKCKIRFASIEPMLSLIELRPSWRGDFVYIGQPEKLDFIICGCATDSRAKDCKLEWIESIVGQCKSAGVACFVKQIPINGRPCKDMSQWPEHLQIREFPKG